jgi:alpha-L-rhamnosidase
MKRLTPSILGALWSVSLVASNLAPERLFCERTASPLAVESQHPKLSWQLSASAPNQLQTAYQIRAASSRDKADHGKFDLWDTGKVSESCTQLPYKGKPLAAGQSVLWQIRVWDSADKPSGWSDLAHWKQAPASLENDQTHWVTASAPRPWPIDPAALHLPPPLRLRKPFEIANRVRRATLYIAALGDAAPCINGQPATDQYFLPGWSNYHQSVNYRALDVTSTILPGPNVLGVTLADGWYAGYVGFGRLLGYGPDRLGRCFYGKDPALLARLEVEFEDGNRKIIPTDSSWKWDDGGPVREADLLMGESFDARLDTPWCTAAFDASTWKHVLLAKDLPKTSATSYDVRGPEKADLTFQPPHSLRSYAGSPVKVVETLKPRSISEPSKGTYIFDFGTNFAGNVRIHLKGEPGQKITLRYAEMLNSDGSLMTENLRKARATDTYICKGDPAGESWMPRFTYHGFQFAEVSGLSTKPDTSSLTGLVLSSDTPLTSAFECSDPLINQLFRNIVRTQRSNFIEVPTDCPQRDERLGRLGHAQVYVRSATLHADVSSFFKKWLQDVREAQRDFGAYPDYAPYPMAHGLNGKMHTTAWMDAGIICPHTLWKTYGDKDFIENHWRSMERFMSFREAMSPRFNGVASGNARSDLLNVDDATPTEWIDAAYFAHSARLMSEMARATDRTDAAHHYDELFLNVRKEFIRTVIARDGTLSGASQSACVLALEFGLHPEGGAQVIADQLAKLIERNGFRMSTGILGTRALLPVLSRNGHHPLAIRLFQSRLFPSWCYSIKNGATSVWEHWDSFTKEDAFDRHNASSNSFSHCAFGSVSDWMFRDLAGITEAEPGFRRIQLHPNPPHRDHSSPENAHPLDFVKASYTSPVGRITSEWRRDASGITYHLHVPPNADATCLIPVPNRGQARVVKGTSQRTADSTASARFILSPGDHQIRVDEAFASPQP